MYNGHPCFCVGYQITLNQLLIIYQTFHYKPIHLKHSKYHQLENCTMFYHDCISFQLSSIFSFNKTYLIY